MEMPYSPPGNKSPGSEIEGHVGIWVCMEFCFCGNAWLAEVEIRCFSEIHPYTSKLHHTFCNSVLQTTEDTLGFGWLRPQTPRDKDFIYVDE